MEEQLIKVKDDLDFARVGLREALNLCGHVEGIIILELIGKTVELRRSVDGLLEAHLNDKWIVLAKGEA